MKAGVRLLMVVAWTLAPISAFAQLPAVPNEASAVPAGFRFGCFSPKRAYSESADGKLAIARLTSLRVEKIRAIAAKNKALQTQEQALQQNAFLSAAERTQRTNEVEELRLDVQRFTQDAQAELTGAQRDLESAFLAKLKPAIEKVARDRELQIVFNLDTGAVAWADHPSLDITEDVVRQLALAH